jgi:hypothetical protein
MHGQENIKFCKPYLRPKGLIHDKLKRKQEKEEEESVGGICVKRSSL